MADNQDHVHAFLQDLADDKDVNFSHDDLKAFQTHAAAAPAAGGAKASKGCRAKCALQFVLCRLGGGKNCGEQLAKCIAGCIGGGGQ